MPDAPVFSPVQAAARPKLATIVADDLRRRILTHELRAGETLPPEHVLLAQLGVSRPTLRQALRLLEAESLLELRRGARGGARVTAPSVDVAAQYTGFLLQYAGVSLDDVARGRLMLEPQLARLVAAGKEKQTIARLRAGLESEQVALDAPGPYESPRDSFHALIARLSGNETVALFVQQISWVVSRLTVERRAQPGHDSRKSARAAHAAHVRFVDLVSQGDAQAAEQFWRRHIAEVDARLLEGRAGQRVVDLPSTMT